MTRRTQFFGTALLLGSTIIAVHAWSLSAQDDVRSSGGAGSATNQGPQGGAPTGFPGGGGAPPGAGGRPGRSGGMRGAGGAPGMMPGASGSMMSQMMGRGPGGGFGSMMGGPAGPVRSKTVTRTFQEVVHETVPPEELEEYEGFQNAMQALKNAKDDAEKKKASDTVREHLIKQLDRDLVQREQELAEVEERVKQLKQQLAKRKASKDDIVTLRLKTIINNVEGLGFPGDELSQETSTFPGGADRAPVVGPPFNLFRTNTEARE